jgi:predicted neuraminidase
MVHRDGAVQAMWFFGSREAGRDVGIFASWLSGDTWLPETRVVDANSEQRARRAFVKTIGNPVLFGQFSGYNWFAYVTPVLGGWSTSRITLRKSDDNGRTWQEPHFLMLSPVLGLSNLDRFPALPMSDGYVGLPVYHELAFSYSAIAVLDASGRVADLRRIGAGSGNKGIQPDLIVGAGGTMETFLRPVGRMQKRLYRSQSSDGGLTWSTPVPTEWTNPSAPACSEQFADGATLLVFNDGEAGRSRLVAWFRRAGGEQWETVDYVFKGAETRERVSYCSLARDGDRIHLVYSRFSDRSIQHAVMNRAWIESRLTGTQIR